MPWDFRCAWPVHDKCLYLQFPDEFKLKNGIVHIKKWAYFFYIIPMERGKK